MPKHSSKIVVLALMALMALGFLEFVEQDVEVSTTPTFTVSRVIDGDTVQLSDGQRVRYIGMDAPEDGECFSSEATLRNVQLVENKDVELVEEGDSVDDHGRLLRKVYVDGEDIGLFLVRYGYARVDEWFAKGSYEQELLQAQEEAKVRE